MRFYLSNAIKNMLKFRTLQPKNMYNSQYSQIELSFNFKIKSKLMFIYTTCSTFKKLFRQGIEISKL